MWSTILDASAQHWQAARRSAAAGSPRILVATTMGSFQHALVVESLVAAGLTLRGASVDFLLCDQSLPACQMVKLNNDDPETLLAAERPSRCPSCFRRGADFLQPLGLTVHLLGDMILSSDRANARLLAATTPLDAIPAYTLDGCRVGEHALAGTLRFLARGDLQDEPRGEEILRRYFEASLLAVLGVDRLLAGQTYDAAVFNHGIYVPQGLIREACARRGVRVVTWNPAYRRRTFVFSHGDSYHHTMIDEPTATWSGLQLSDQQRATLADYLNGRRTGREDWIWFNKQPDEDADAVLQRLGLRPDRPIVTLLTSVVWDAQLHYAANAFPDMMAWIEFTVAHLAQRPDLQLVIRVHPAEATGTVPSRQRVVEELARRFPALPGNVTVVAPDDGASTYVLLERSNAALIYSTKTGIEASCLGIPTIVAGEAWIRNKGFSLDATSPEEYATYLDQLPFRDGLSAAERELALRYAYHFFFRRMLPIAPIEVGEKNQMTLAGTDLQAFAEGGDPGLEVICRGILDGSPFIYDGAHLSRSEAGAALGGGI